MRLLELDELVLDDAEDGQHLLVLEVDAGVDALQQPPHCSEGVSDEGVRRGLSALQLSERTFQRLPTDLMLSHNLRVAFGSSFGV